MALQYPSYKKGERVRRAENRLQTAENAGPADDVGKAASALAAHTAPEAYRSPNEAQQKKALLRLSETKPFVYDPESDPLYRRYRADYLSDAERAMRDTAGMAAANTGGYSSSYAASAGAGAYQKAFAGLQKIMPALYEQAYRRSRDETEDLRDLYGLYTAEDERQYGRYRDDRSDFAADRDYLYDRYRDARDTDDARRRDVRDYYAKRLDAERDWDADRYDADLGRAISLYQLLLKEEEQAEKRRQFDVLHG